LGKALLFETIHTTLQLGMATDPETTVLQINTDGFIISTKKPDILISGLTSLGILGDTPGKLRAKGIYPNAHGFFLGPNAWWITREDTLLESCGHAKPTHEEKPQTHGGSPIPNQYTYVYHGVTQTMDIIHLAEFQSKLIHEGKELPRQPFIIPAGVPPPIPQSIVAEEKKRSFQLTLALFEDLRKTITKISPNYR
jgi:hypothetical protein